MQWCCTVSQPQTKNIDNQQSSLFLLLSWPTIPLSGKWGDFVDRRTFVNLIIFFLLRFLKLSYLSFFMKFVTQSKTKKGKYTEIFPPLLLWPTYMYMRTCNAESQKSQQKVPVLKETTGLCPSLCYYSTVWSQLSRIKKLGIV